MWHVLRSIYKHDVKDIYKLISVVLLRSNTNSSKIIVRHLSTLEFLITQLNCFSKKRWYITINAANKTDMLHSFLFVSSNSQHK
ncbi:hypothetical protein XM47_17335 [Catenovulum maritimum]|uniref:Uncharacterized protein n=1 Tax=Catenovulum maritimum TaxID=1513271 RepID=A0A0J8GM49_9ALTE|nr:hypothetical protein XM47_17335 [Catenovulum maritimum]